MERSNSVEPDEAQYEYIDDFDIPKPPADQYPTHLTCTKPHKCEIAGGKGVATSVYETLNIEKTGETTPEKSDLKCKRVNIVLAVAVVALLLALAAGLGWYFGSVNRMYVDGSKTGLYSSKPIISGVTESFASTGGDPTQDGVTVSAPSAWCLEDQQVCKNQGWQIWLRRVDNSLSFDRTWEEYERGFGNCKDNCWLGLESLHSLTSAGRGQMIRAEIESWKGEKKWAEYRYFSVSDKTDNYRMTVGRYNHISTAPDQMYFTNGSQFTTRYEDNDGWSGNCANLNVGGGWWYGSCTHMSPTSLIGEEEDRLTKMYWLFAFDGHKQQALKSLIMMIKPYNLETPSTAQCVDDDQSWLVWIRRVDNSVSFDRTWDEYEKGFGNCEDNYWLGLASLHTITKKGKGATIKVKLESWKGETKWAEYGYFSVSDEADNYRMTVGEYNRDSTAPDQMYFTNGSQFTTRFRYNDPGSDLNCANLYAGGGWWYKSCTHTTPTAQVGKEGDVLVPYMYWLFGFDGEKQQALKSLIILIKPNDSD